LSSPHPSVVVDSQFYYHLQLHEIQQYPTILMTAFAIDDKIFREYTKMKIINGFLQKPIGIHDLLKEVDTQLHSYEMQQKFPS